MPNVIITPGFAALRSRYKYLEGQALAQGVQDTSNIVAQALLVYSQKKEQEDKDRLNILSNMVATYGDKVGQPALQQMDQILRRKGVGGLPKDPVTGAIVPPPATIEQMKADALRQDPKLLQSAIQKEMTGMSPIQVSFKQQELQLKQRHQQVMEEFGQLNADAHMLSAKASLARATKEDALSSIVQMPDGSIKSMAEVVDPTTGQVPPGTVALTGKQANSAIALLREKNSQAIKQKDQELKQARMDYDKQKMATMFSFKAESAMYQAAKVWGAKTTTDAQRKVLRPKLEHVLRQNDVPEDEIKNFFEGPPSMWSKVGGYFADFFQPPEHQPVIRQIESEQKLQGIDSPPIPGTRRLKSGKVLQEEVVPNEGQ